MAAEQEWRVPEAVAMDRLGIEELGWIDDFDCESHSPESIDQVTAVASKSPIFGGVRVLEYMRLSLPGHGVVQNAHAPGMEYPVQLSHGGCVVWNHVQDMGADPGIEASVWEWRVSEVSSHQGKRYVLKILE